MIKPRTPPGVLELLPNEQIAFQRFLDVIRQTYERYGFLPIQTPVFERSDVLLTKSGGDTERQVYFVQSTGALAQSQGEGSARPELALRFDLTVPLARYVAEHEHALTFPFRRYQVQQVYRGERAQRGRFREFYQCDIDIVGKDTLSLRYDAELVAVIHAVFTELKIGDFCVQLNHRQLLRGLLETLGLSAVDLQQAVLREIDKLDKREHHEVCQSITGLGVLADQAEQLLAMVVTQSQGHEDALQQLQRLKHTANASPRLQQGVAELSQVIELIRAFGVPEHAYRLNLAIARGLDYYTGIVYETQLIKYPHIGSVCSGGRYENLASHYTHSQLPGVGISIGLTRLFWQLRDAGFIHPDALSGVQVMVALLEDAMLADVLEIAQQLRAGHLCTEVQMDAKKIGRQIQYAVKARIRFVVLMGQDERQRGVVSVKDLIRQQQFEVKRDELVATLQVELEQEKAMILSQRSQSER